MSLEPIFTSSGAGFLPSEHARGPWDAGALHGGAPSALLARAVERLEPGAQMLVTRITLDFLGPVPLGPVQMRAAVTKPGRQFQVVDAELSAGGKVVLRARAVRMRRGRAAVALHEPERRADVVAFDPPHAGTPSAFPGSAGGASFQRTGMEIRFVGGTSYAPGPARAWFRLARPLVDDETPTPLQRVVAAADFGNGVSRLLDFDTHLFTNTDLTVHLDRDALGEWVLLDARTTIGPAGTGLAVSSLHDEQGAIGVAAQSLFVAAR